MDVVTMNGDEFNRKGSISGGYHDERAGRLLTLEKIRGLRRDLDKLTEERKGMQAKVECIALRCWGASCLLLAFPRGPRAALCSFLFGHVIESHLPRIEYLCSWVMIWLGFHALLSVFLLVLFVSSSPLPALVGLVCRTNAGRRQEATKSTKKKTESSTWKPSQIVPGRTQLVASIEFDDATCPFLGLAGLTAVVWDGGE